MRKLLIPFILFQSLFSIAAMGQDNYEIQVYGAETLPKHNTMFELHSNFTLSGSKTTINGVLPTNHIFHETIEITHGFTNWFETGFYLFNAIGNNGRSSYVGSHVRPRIALPQKYHFPVGLSLSAEVGFQKTEYSEDDWTLEIRPIIDKTIQKWYLSLNPVFGKALHGLNSSGGFVFSPNAKVSYSVTKHFVPGLEYYGSLGAIAKFSAFQYQQEQLFLALDLYYSDDWEFNAGYGIGFTNSTDRSIFKIIVGRRLHR